MADTLAAAATGIRTVPAHSMVDSFRAYADEAVTSARTRALGPGSHNTPV